MYESFGGKVRTSSNGPLRRRAGQRVSAEHRAEREWGQIHTSCRFTLPADSHLLLPRQLPSQLQLLAHSQSAGSKRTCTAHALRMRQARAVLAEWDRISLAGIPQLWERLLESAPLPDRELAAGRSLPTHPPFPFALCACGRRVAVGNGRVHAEGRARTPNQRTPPAHPSPPYQPHPPDIAYATRKIDQTARATREASWNLPEPFCLEPT